MGILRSLSVSLLVGLVVSLVLFPIEWGQDPYHDDSLSHQRAVSLNYNTKHQSIGVFWIQVQHKYVENAGYFEETETERALTEASKVIHSMSNAYVTFTGDQGRYLKFNLHRWNLVFNPESKEHVFDSLKPKYDINIFVYYHPQSFVPLDFGFDDNAIHLQAKMLGLKCTKIKLARSILLHMGGLKNGQMGECGGGESLLQSDCKKISNDGESSSFLGNGNMQSGYLPFYTKYRLGLVAKSQILWAERGKGKYMITDSNSGLTNQALVYRFFSVINNEELEYSLELHNCNVLLRLSNGTKNAFRMPILNDRFVDDINGFSFRILSKNCSRATIRVAAMNPPKYPEISFGSGFQSVNGKVRILKPPSYHNANQSVPYLIKQISSTSVLLRYKDESNLPNGKVIKINNLSKPFIHFPTSRINLFFQTDENGDVLVDYRYEKPRSLFVIYTYFDTIPSHDPGHITRMAYEGNQYGENINGALRRLTENRIQFFGWNNEIPMLSEWARISYSDDTADIFRECTKLYTDSADASLPWDHVQIVLSGRDNGLLFKSVVGRGTMGGPTSWVKLDTILPTPLQSYQTSLHEFGHNFGLEHSSSLECSLKTDTCNHVEYGDHFDIMGISTSGVEVRPLSLSLFQRIKLNLVNPDNVRVNGNGKFTIKAGMGALLDLKVPWTPHIVPDPTYSEKTINVVKISSITVELFSNQYWNKENGGCGAVVRASDGNRAWILLNEQKARVLHVNDILRIGNGISVSVVSMDESCTTAVVSIQKGWGSWLTFWF